MLITYALFFLFQRFVAAPFADSHWFLYLINEGIIISNALICLVALLASLLLARSLKLCMTWLLVFVSTTVLIFNPCFGHEQKPVSNKQIKVLTYNMAHCRVSNLESIMKVIVDAGADIVCLQEASILDQDTHKLSAYLRKTFPKSFIFSATNNLIISKFPLSEKSFHDVPTKWDKKRFPEVVVRTPHGDLRVICVHCEPSWVSPWNTPPAELVTTLQKVVKDRAVQQQMILDRVRASQEPILVAGDFNGTAQSTLPRAMSHEMTDSMAATTTGIKLTLLPAIPYCRIDFVFTKGVRPLKSEVIQSKASDHFPVAVTLEF